MLLQTLGVASRGLVSIMAVCPVELGRWVIRVGEFITPRKHL